MRYWISLLVVLFHTSAASAYNMYKCKDEEGNVVFSQTRCIGTVSEKINVQPATGEDDPDRRHKSMTERANENQHSQQYNKHRQSSGKVMSLTKPKPAAVPKNIRKCTYEKDRISNIRSRMRAGYSSQHGEHLRNQLKDAEKKVKRYCQ